MAVNVPVGQKQLISVPFAQGIDTKTDPKQLMPGKLQALSNGILTQTGLVSRRWGYTSLTTVGGAAIGLASFNNELVAFTGNVNGSFVESYSISKSTWYPRPNA